MERTEEMKRYVLDTSVVVKWFSTDEQGVDNAIALRQHMLEGTCSIVIPELLVYELANALRHNPNFTARDVQESMDSVFDMGLDVRKVDNAVITCAIDIAYRFMVTVYDAYSLALAQIEKISFVTADYKFWGRVKDCRGIIKLSDLNIR